MALTTLFGFQLNVIFTSVFKEDLSSAERLSHVAALTLGLLAIGLVMLPSAYGRQAEPRQVSRRMVRIISRSLTIAMVPLLFSITIDFAIILRVVLGDGGIVPPLAAAALGSYFAALWFVSTHSRSPA